MKKLMTLYENKWIIKFKPKKWSFGFSSKALYRHTVNILTKLSFKNIPWSSFLFKNLFRNIIIHHIQKLYKLQSFVSWKKETTNATGYFFFKALNTCWFNCLFPVLTIFLAICTSVMRFDAFSWIIVEVWKDARRNVTLTSLH